MRINSEYKSHYQNAYSYINAACCIYDADVHDDKKCAISAAHSLAESLLPSSGSKNGRIHQRFMSALTCKGYIDFTLNSCSGLIEITSTEYGSPFISELSREASARGYNCIIGKDPIMPDKCSVLILPQLGIGFTCRKPKEELRSSDRAVYRSLLSKAVHELKSAKKLHDELEGIYIKAVDFAGLTQFTERKASELCQMLKNAKHKDITF